MSTEFLTIGIIEYKPLDGSSYIELPKWIQKKKAVIKVKNKDIKCLLWAILSAIYIQVKDPQRFTKYKQYENELNFKGISFTTPINEIPKFEKQNNLIISVYRIENDRIEPLKISERIKSGEDYDKVINLLLIKYKNNSHYCWIKDFSSLVRSQVTKNHQHLEFCPTCLSHYDSKEKLVKKYGRLFKS
jgi:hypothetical protein